MPSVIAKAVAEGKSVEAFAIWDNIRPFPQQ